MKNQILVSLIALLTVMTLTGVFAAVPVADQNTFGVDQISVTVNGNDVFDNVDALEAGDVVPVKVIFTQDSFDSISDVQVKVTIDDESETTSKFVVLSNLSYAKYFSIRLPTDFDSSESEYLTVEIEGEANGVNKFFVQRYALNVQRKSYNAEILDVQSDRTVKAGDNLAVDLVVKNMGYEELENLFVTVSIPELGVQKRAYFDDLVPNDTCDECDKEDSAIGKVFLRIPSNAKAGVYDMTVEAENAETSSVVTQKIIVVGAEEESKVLVPVTSRDIASGNTESYDIVIVNSGSKVAIYEILPETASGVTVSTDKSVVVVPAGSSETVKISVKGNKEGTYNIGVNVNSEGKLVKRIVLNASVSEKTFTGNVAILTIVLAIVFLVLLVVLIVLLTRKPAKSEELEESYY